MPLVASRLFLALDARAVSAAFVSGGLGRRRVQGFVRVPLAPGELVPSPSSENLQRPDQVREALGRALEALGRAHARCTLVLPDGIARFALLPLPPDADASEYVRFRLAASLPWPSSEAIVDVLPAGRGFVVGAAVRRSVVAEYEQAAASSGLDLERVHLAPLLALGTLLHARSQEAVHVVLGDTAACIAAVSRGRVVALSSRRRDSSAGEAARLLEDAERTARLATNGRERHTVLLSGSDSARLRSEGGTAGPEPALAAPGEWPDAAEAVWLRGLLA